MIAMIRHMLQEAPRDIFVMLHKIFLPKDTYADGSEWFKPGSGGWKQKCIWEGGMVKKPWMESAVYAPPQYRSYWEPKTIIYSTRLDNARC